MDSLEHLSVMSMGALKGDVLRTTYPAFLGQALELQGLPNGRSVPAQKDAMITEFHRKMLGRKGPSLTFMR